jgi:hypothetical protein
MTPGKHRRLLGQLEGLRRQGGVKSSDLIALVEAIGRWPKDRGKHVTYVSALPGTRPITIPCHGNRDVNRFVKDNILDQLEEDLELEATRLSEEDNGS